MTVLSRFGKITVMCATALYYRKETSVMLHSRFPKKSISVALATVAATAMLCAPLFAPAASARPLGIPSAEGLPKSLADLIEHVSPAVVNIRVVTGGAAAGHPTQDATEGQGSGFIVSADGKIVTNYHVIEGGDKITVDFANGEEFSARIIGTDRETDLAMLQIQDKRSFDYVEFHKGADVRIGDWALAIGNPFGIGQSSSVGIISAIGRERVDSGSYVDYMQTDATVNRGNSGGPLFNFEGRVIGVNSAIYSPTGASVGIAFVIPHDLAEEIVADLARYGKAREVRRTARVCVSKTLFCALIIQKLNRRWKRPARLPNYGLVKRRGFLLNAMTSFWMQSRFRSEIARLKKTG
jgi:serine protease Do